jgi:esterase
MSDNLSMIARAFSDDFTVYSLDLRNHGRSPWAESMTFPEMAADVIAFMDKHGITCASILGHSLGGKVAMQCALSYPERVEKIVVADIAPVEYPPHHNEVLEGLGQVDLAGISSRRDAEQTLASHIDEKGVRQFLLKSLYKENDHYLWRFNLDVIGSRYDDLRQAIDGSVFGREVLFIKGEQSKYIQAKHQDAILRLFPNFEFKMLQNAGHWLHAEKPKAFNRLAGQFLNG